MKIIIIGCGKVGSALAEELTMENHEVAIVDISAQKLQEVGEDLDALQIHGNGSSINVLMDAGVTSADLVIAVTGSDELNLLCCLVAKNLGKCHTVARVRNPIYNKEINLMKESLGISMIINPEMATAAEIARLLRFPSAIKIDPFAKGKVELLKFRLKPEFRLDGKSIVEINMKGKHNILVAGVERGEQVFIPNGDFVLQNGDLVSILASPKNASAFFKSIGLKTNQVRNCMIVGGGTIAIFLARMLLEMKMRVVIIEQSKELKQTILSGQGEFHLRTLKWRVENNDKLPIIFEEPRIPYRETITKAARADYRHKKQSGGAGQFGEVHIIIEPYTEGMPAPDTYRFGNQEFKMNVRDTQEIPLEWGGKLVVCNCIVGGAIDTRFIPAIVKGLMDRMEQGPLTGSYARDVRVCIYDGKMHPVDSNEISFRLAARNAFSEAFRAANPKILEPVYDVEVMVPGDVMGDVMSDLQGRRAIIMGMNSENGFEKIIAKVPLKEMSSYSTALSSITGGRSSFTMKFSAYELVPGDVQEKLLAEYAAKNQDE